MSERTGVITVKGNPKTLLGPELKVGQAAPAFTLRGQDLSEIKLDSFKGKTLIVATVPSLDTPVCDTETRRFNQEAASLGDNIRILVVSVDLPMAQKRWCGAAGVDKVQTASDYYDHNFGKAWGLRIKELGLLARSVTVIDPAGKVKYHELVKEVASEPDYAAALKAAKN